MQCTCIPGMPESWSYPGTIYQKDPEVFFGGLGYKPLLSDEVWFFDLGTPRPPTNHFAEKPLQDPFGCIVRPTPGISGPEYTRVAGAAPGVHPDLRYTWGPGVLGPETRVHSALCLPRVPGMPGSRVSPIRYFVFLSGTRPLYREVFLCHLGT